MPSIQITGFLLRWLLLAHLLFWQQPWGCLAQGGKKPNLLFFLGESVRPMDFAAYGGLADIAPHLNQLIGSRGTIRIEQMHVPFPLCNPSRASILLGRSPDDIGVKTNYQKWQNQDGADDWISLPRFLQNNGYFTVSGGKLFHKGTNDAGAWRVFNGMDNIDELECVKDLGAKMFALRGGTTLPRVVGCMTPSNNVADFIMATDAVAQLDRIALRPEERTPFAMFIGFHLPHYPIRVTNRLVINKKRILGMKFPKFEAPRNLSQFRNGLSFDSPRPQAPGKGEADPFYSQIPASLKGGDTFSGPGPSSASRKSLLWAHLSGVRQMDVAAGQVLNALKAKGFYENTLIVFISDHSVALGETRLFEKDMPLDIATRVPFFVHVPWSSRPPATTGPNVLMDGVDVFRTVVALLGLTPPKGAAVKGRDLSNVILGASSLGAAADPSATTAFSQVGRCSNLKICDGVGLIGMDQIGYTVRTKDWRYIVYMAGANGKVKGWGRSQIISEELYDHSNDRETIFNPSGAVYTNHEFVNRAYDLPQVSARMFSIIQARFQRGEYQTG